MFSCSIVFAMQTYVRISVLRQGKLSRFQILRFRNVIALFMKNPREEKRSLQKKTIKSVKRMCAYVSWESARYRYRSFCFFRSVLETPKWTSKANFLWQKYRAASLVWFLSSRWRMLLRWARGVGEKRKNLWKKLFARFTTYKIAQQPLHQPKLNQQGILPSSSTADKWTLCNRNRN